VGEYGQVKNSLGLTIVLGLYFTALQGLEYYEASFRFADSIYGSTFFIATGFHGLHVIVGTLFLLVCWVRHLKGEFSAAHHFGFEAAAWY
jgi:cytochrome c oxidase subunit 3